MESQTIPPSHGHGHGHVYEEDPKPIGLHSVVVEDQEEHGGGHHEKQSVLKKVKAKARKLKDTITKHGHSHDEHHIPDDHDLDEEEYDDEDEEMVNDPEVHGAPMYDSATVPAVGFAHSAPSKAPGDPRRHENLHHPGGNMEHLRNEEGGGPTPMNTPLSTAATPLTTQLIPDDPTRVLVRGQDSAPRVNLTRPHGLEEDPQGPTNPSRQPPNYETKVTGPTNSRGNEAKIEPLSSSFGEMKIGDKGEVKTSEVTGSHDQYFSPPGSYSDKISSATSAVADKAVTAKNLVASKLGYGSTEGERLPQEGGGYTDKISSAGHVIADTAASAKNLVASKLGSKEELTEGHYSALKPKSGPTGQLDKGVSVREYWVEKLRPGEEDKALSEVISSALHTAGNKKKDTSSARPVGVVTESEEVRRYLGESGKDEGRQMSSPGKKVVNTLKGTVESWFGKEAGDQSTNQTPSHDHHHGEEHMGERRLKESSQ